MDSTGFELKVGGIVQGVGFRPFVYRLARKYGLNGTVANRGDGVVIRIAPPLDNYGAFRDELAGNPPPLSRITSIEERPINGFSSETGFTILASEKKSRARTMIPPDVAICADCLRELFDPADRRHRYPFINCTNCGPRFTIVESIPYDRPKTSMKVFPMCPACEREYHDPGDRRFHAQPNACYECGPHLSWHDRQGHLIDRDDPVGEALVALGRGRIVAIRGLGGFHLAVDAANEEAVAELRRRKGRRNKPLAIMVADLDAARSLCLVTGEEEELLTSHQRPIVLLRKKKDAELAPSLAPGIVHLGVMLPYTPFHHLLLKDPRSPVALVMTSGNASNEPICTANEDALNRLARIADFFLLHNREIVTRVDDSVTRVAAGRPRFLRRARGYVPDSVRLAAELPEVLACGGELKNTFCLTRGRNAFLSQHIGDLNSVEILTFFEESVAHLQEVFEIAPTAVACDLHPDYLSSRYAGERGLPLYRVQHHHAHAVAVMAEHGLEEETLAVVLDGTGYGPDKTIWGGEILLAGLSSYRRLGHLDTLLLPGGDAAAREPWRMALAAQRLALGAAGTGEECLVPSLRAVPADRRAVLAGMMDKKINSPLTSSCGRLFDAVAALIGLRRTIDYEGQAAMELEACAWKALGGRRPSPDFLEMGHILPVSLKKGEQALIMESGPMLRTVIESVKKDVPAGEIAFAFHKWCVATITAALEELTGELGRKKIVLSGGCLQNELLLCGLVMTLEDRGFQVYTGERVPVNDGGISLGQAVVAGLTIISD